MTRLVPKPISKPPKPMYRPPKLISMQPKPETKPKPRTNLILNSKLATKRVPKLMKKTGHHSVSVAAHIKIAMLAAYWKPIKALRIQPLNFSKLIVWTKSCWIITLWVILTTMILVATKFKLWLKLASRTRETLPYKISMLLTIVSLTLGTVEVSIITYTRKNKKKVRQDNLVLNQWDIWDVNRIKP